MKKILDFSERYSIQIFVFLMCVPTLLHIRIGDINSYHTFFYLIDYSTGFGGKKLLGEICSIWMPYEVGRQHILPLIAIVEIIMVALFTWFCGRCINRNPKNKQALIVFVAIYLLSPFSFTMLIKYISRIDFYLATATLLFLYLFIRYRGTTIYYILTLLITCLACLIHHIFCNIFFPLIFALFIYDIFSSTNQATKKTAYYSVITLSIFLLFLSIVLFSKMNIDYESLYNYLQGRSTESTSALSLKGALYYEYYAKLPEHYIAYVQPVLKYNVARFVLTIIILSPLLLLFWIPWILAIRHSTNKREKWCYFIMQLSIHLIILPAYLMAIDYDRWNCAYCFIQFCLIVILYYFEEKTFVEQVDKIICVLKQHLVIVLLILIYINSIELANDNSTLAIVDTICNKLGLFWKVNEIIPYI